MNNPNYEIEMDEAFAQLEGFRFGNTDSDPELCWRNAQGEACKLQRYSRSRDLMVGLIVNMLDTEDKFMCFGNQLGKILTKDFKAEDIELQEQWHCARAVMCADPHQIGEALLHVFGVHVSREAAVAPVIEGTGCSLGGVGLNAALMDELGEK